MCEHHDHRGISRRRLGALALGLGGLAAFPGLARAANVTALALTCIDYRLVDDGVQFLNGLGLRDDFDQVALAGASLAAVSPKFPSSNAAFWDHVDIAKALHHVTKLVVVDHRDCGAYKVAFGDKFAPSGKPEREQHRGVMLEAQAMLKRKHPHMASEFYLMALDGKAERIL